MARPDLAPQPPRRQPSPAPSHTAGAPLWRRQGSALVAGLTLMLALLASPGAALQPGTRSAPPGLLPDPIISAGLSRIADIYLVPVGMRRLSLDGLAGLSAIDPQVAITLPQPAGDTLRLTHQGQTVGDFRLPLGDGPETWAGFVTRVVEAAAAVSPTLAATPREKIHEALFTAIVTDLDSYSRYSGPSEATDERSQREGYGGIGIAVRHEGTLHRITDVMAGSPAQGAGLKKGDLVLAIDGDPTDRMSAEQLAARIRGPAGTAVQITAGPDPATRRQVSVRRDRVIPPTVEATLDGRLGVLTISRFNAATSVQVREAVRKLRRQAGSLQGLILDLRGNPGGLLDQAVAVADQFLTSGPVITTRGRHPDSLQRFDAAPDDVMDGAPIVVLVDGRSASAAEIVAVALQDSGRAVVVGASTFGKGSVQTVTRLPNDGELFLTWSRIYSPAGFTLHGQGVHPTLCTSQGPASADDVVAALRRGSLVPASTIAAWRARAPDDTVALAFLRETCPDKPAALPALDDAVARALVKDKALYRRALSLSRSSYAQRPE